MAYLRRSATHPAAARCGVPRRLLAMLYDSLIVIALLFIAALAALPLAGGTQQVMRDPVYTAWILGVWFFYLGWCWTHGGQTVGLRAWRVRLHPIRGGTVGWRACAIRFGVSLLSAAALGAGFWWAWTNDERATWHDLASGTRLRRVAEAGAAGSDRTAQDVDDDHGKQQ
jgi:uncharacterized RDD family membrane protein YckC